MIRVFVGALLLAVLSVTGCSPNEMVSREYLSSPVMEFDERSADRDLRGEVGGVYGGLDGGGCSS